MELVNKLIFKNIINLRSISDKNIKLERVLKKKFKFQYFYNDYKKILNDKQIDVVLILTSMKEHASIDKKA